MEDEGSPAVCPECQTEYTWHEDPRARSWRTQPLERRADGRLKRTCFACSSRSNPWDALWLPAIFVAVATFPLFGFVSVAILGHFMIVFAVLLPLWRRVLRHVRRSRSGRSGNAALPGQRLPSQR